MVCVLATYLADQVTSRKFNGMVIEGSI